MSNDYFNHTSTFSSFTKATASAVNSVFESIASGLEFLPTRAMFREGNTNFAVDNGSADNYSVSRTYSATGLVDGMKVRMKVGAGNTNTGACTINVDSLGALGIKLVNGSDPAAGDLTAGDFVELVYDADNTRWIITSAVRSSL